MAIPVISQYITPRAHLPTAADADTSGPLGSAFPAYKEWDERPYYRLGHTDDEVARSYSERKA